MTVTSSSAPATTSMTDGLSLESALQFCGITRHVMKEWDGLEGGRDEHDDINGAERLWNQTDQKSKMELAKGIVGPNKEIMVIEPNTHQHRFVIGAKWKCAISIVFLFSIGMTVLYGLRVFTNPDDIVSDNNIKNPPTAAPTTETFPGANVTLQSPFPLRLNDLVELAMRISGRQALKDDKSPAHSALEWMKGEDIEKKKGNIISESMRTTTKHEILERYSLAVLYFSLHNEIFSDMRQRLRNEDPFEYDALNTRSTWLSHVHHCEWKGISCNDSKSVTHIHLRDQQLSGSMPNAELAQFLYLHTLDLGQNKLRGTLPNGLYKLKTLKHLYLHNNRFSGSISSKIKNLKNLASIYIGDNRLDGTIPSSLKDMHNLRSVSMLRNKLTGTVPTFGESTLYLDLGSNELEGPLPSDITIYPELAMLYLDNNNFQGTVPTLYAKHRGIQQLWLNNNKLTGTFPDFYSAAALLTIRSEGNDLTIGSQMCTLSALVGEWSLVELGADCDKCNCDILCDKTRCY